MNIQQEIVNKLMEDKENMIDVIMEDRIDLRSEMSKFDDSDVEVTLRDYIDDMIKPMEDIRVYDKLTSMLGGSDYEDIKILTPDSVRDEDTFNKIFDTISIYQCKDIGDYSVVDVYGYKVAYTYQEGGYPVILMKM